MGKFEPALLAFLLNSYGIYIFRTPKDFECFPYISYELFLLSVFFLLWDACIYPASFRKLYSWADFLLEFSADMFAMELIMNDFWLPLERSFISFIPFLSECLSQSPMLEELCIKLKSPETLYAASYGLSVFFLLCILHATRVIDFRILGSCEIKNFLQDANRRTQHFIKRKFKMCTRKNRPNHIRFAPEAINSRCRPSNCEDDVCNRNDYNFDDMCVCATRY